MALEERERLHLLPGSTSASRSITNSSNNKLLESTGPSGENDYDEDSPYPSQSSAQKTNQSSAPAPGTNPTIISSIAELMLTPKQEELYEAATEAIIKSIEPKEEQIIYRQSVIELLKKQIRNALNSSAVEVGLHELRCFLPDDPIKLSVIVIQSFSGTQDLHKILMEQFNAYETSRKQERHTHGLPADPTPQERGSGSGNTHSSLNSSSSSSSLPSPASTSSPQQGQSYLDNSRECERGLNSQGDFSASSSEYQHSITNVSFSKHNMGFKVICTIDGMLEAEILLNNRSDLVILAFIEEMDQRVGRNHLFKRSLLLIRAWWFYETAQYMGASIKHYLSDFSLIVMICATFNQYNDRIHTVIS